MNKTMILAIGGAGCNMAEYCHRNASSEWLKNADFIFADTDKESIKRFERVGFQTVTLNPDSSDMPLPISKDLEKVVILAGLGGNTGNSFITSAAQKAISMGVEKVNLIVTLPFLFEGEAKISKAVQTLNHLSGFKVAVLNNESLVSLYPNLGLFDAFDYSDREVLKAIEEIG